MDSATSQTDQQTLEDETIRRDADLIARMANILYDELPVGYHDEVTFVHINTIVARIYEEVIRARCDQDRS